MQRGSAYLGIGHWQVWLPSGYFARALSRGTRSLTLTSKKKPGRSRAWWPP